jgi:hypothetical protein
MFCGWHDVILADVTGAHQCIISCMVTAVVFSDILYTTKGVKTGI